MKLPCLKVGFTQSGLNGLQQSFNRVKDEHFSQVPSLKLTAGQPLKTSRVPKWNLMFQPFMFTGELLVVSFREGKSNELSPCLMKRIRKSLSYTHQIILMSHWLRWFPSLSFARKSHLNKRICWCRSRSLVHGWVAGRFVVFGSYLEERVREGEKKTCVYVIVRTASQLWYVCNWGVTLFWYITYITYIGLSELFQLAYHMYAYFACKTYWERWTNCLVLNYAGFQCRFEGRFVHTIQLT